MKPARPAGAWVRDLRGAARLTVDGVQGVVGVVEAMHQRIASVVPRPGGTPERRTRGITGLVYRSVRAGTRWTGLALDATLAGLERWTGPAADDAALAPAERDAVVAALNGVLGDHLERTGNPLATPMRLMRRDASAATGDIAVLVHGLCMNEAQWTRAGHDHGSMLQQALGWTPVYARYNSGRHVSSNGADLARAIAALCAGWPVPVRSLTLVGHSMGGLVIRAAVHQAQAASHDWVGSLTGLVFLGTPHHGAMLERGGNWIHALLGAAPYAAPLARVSGLRSEGITDLRFGNLLESDWRTERFGHRDQRTPVPLPAGVAAFAVAGTLGDGWSTDGLVSVDSALGRHARRPLALRVPKGRQFVAQGVHHLDLLSSQAVARQLQRWLGAPPAGGMKSGSARG